MERLGAVPHHKIFNAALWDHEVFSEKKKKNQLAAGNVEVEKVLRWWKTTARKIGLNSTCSKCSHHLVEQGV